MDQNEWCQFLEQYSQELMKVDEPQIVIPPEARKDGWMGFAPASEEAIAACETRLGRTLPPSLRTFYSVTNGWRTTGYFIWDILPVEQIGWLCDRKPFLHQLACESEKMPGPWRKDPDGSRLREYRNEQGTRVKRSLVISSTGDAADWLLDPGAEAHTGEWPAGRWASWNPAMQWSADNFADLMHQELASFIQLRNSHENTK